MFKEYNFYPIKQILVYNYTRNFGDPICDVLTVL